jgi:hypothetical protein
MVDPTKGDETFKKSYTVEATNEYTAFKEAEKLQANDEPNIKYRSIFDYKVTLK